MNEVETGPGIVSGVVAAKLLMLTPHRLRQLVGEGRIKRLGRDRYRVVDVVQGYIAFLRDEGRQAPSAAGSRVHDARAHEIALRVVDKRAALLADGEAEAINVIDEYAGSLRVDIAAIPARATNDLAMRRKLEDLFETAFGAAAKRACAAADRLEAASPKTTRNQRRQARKSEARR